MLRRTLLTALGAAAAAPAFADDWPNRQVKIVIPYPPGGPTDISTRIVMDKVGQLLGQSVLFDNKGGASGMIGAAYAKTNDRWQFLATTVAVLTRTRHLQAILRPDKDPHRCPHVDLLVPLTIHPSVPANNMAEFVAYVKANPGKVNYGSSGNATITALLRDAEPRNRHQMVHIPYRAAPGRQPSAGQPDQAQPIRPRYRTS
jgi:tripartite-type tricarboxylate transporter receptor subunit TctC